MRTSAAVVWLDRDQAKFIHISEDKMERRTFRSTGEAETLSMFGEVAQSLGNSDRILLLGTEGVNIRFHDWLKATHPGFASRVVACEEADQPTDGQFATYAFQYF